MPKYNYNIRTGRLYVTVSSDDEWEDDYRDVNYPPRPTEWAAFARLRAWERRRQVERLAYGLSKIT